MRQIHRTVWLGALLLLGGLQASAAAKTIEFAGYRWEVRSGEGRPGPCLWAEDNVWLDALGRLHLKLSQEDGTWSCAEVTTIERLGFGTYQFWVGGPLDTLDPNVVLGLFNYPTPDVGSDGTNEIDIEFARWGDPTADNLSYTLWPRRPGLPRSRTHEMTLSRPPRSTHRFTWTPSRLFFQSLRGYTNGNAGEIARWSYRPANPAQVLPQEPLPLHINLWLFEGQPPTDGREVEIVVRAVRFTPR